VLRPIIEQQLRIHYPRVLSPQGHLQTQPQLVFSSQPEEEYNTLEPSRSSFNTKGKTPWNLQVFLQHEGNNTKMCSRDDTPLDQANRTVLDPKRRLREKRSTMKSSLRTLQLSQSYALKCRELRAKTKGMKVVMSETYMH
ncbi:hypothetical protein Taro_040428, partial [Colocasia esculenta]|nr:hypothetical protein [Colocasia esculenta]